MFQIYKYLILDSINWAALSQNVLAVLKILFFFHLKVLQTIYKLYQCDIKKFIGWDMT